MEVDPLNQPSDEPEKNQKEEPKQRKKESPKNAAKDEARKDAGADTPRDQQQQKDQKTAGDEAKSPAPASKKLSGQQTPKRVEEANVDAMNARSNLGADNMVDQALRTPDPNAQQGRNEPTLISPARQGTFFIQRNH
jgi:hypothetical protein